MQKLSENEKKETVAFLGMAPLLKVLSLEERTKLAKYTTKHVYNEGDLIIEQGADADGVFILASGTAVAEMDGEAVHTDYTVGDFFGEVALLHGGVRTASVRATGAAGASCFKITKEEFQVVMGMSGDMLAARQQTYACQIIEKHWLKFKQGGGGEGAFVMMGVEERANGTLALRTEDGEGSR